MSFIICWWTNCGDVYFKKDGEQTFNKEEAYQFKTKKAAEKWYYDRFECKGSGYIEEI